MYRTPPAAGPSCAAEHLAQEVLDVDPFHALGREPQTTAIAPTATARPPRRSPRTGSGSGVGPGAGPGIGIDAIGNLAKVQPERVVLPSRLRVGQHVVRLGNL